jgi:serine/threonine protein kinase
MALGAVYLGINITTLAEVAIKLEAKKTPADCSTLEQECLIYRALAGTTAVPHMHWYGPTRQHNALVMDRLGWSLEDLFNKCWRKFSLKTVLLLADQMVWSFILFSTSASMVFMSEQISQLEVVHARHIIHRDIKPDNFIMGYGETCNRVFVVDFGMSKYYCNPKTRKHNKMITGKPFLGTARYASISAHLGLGE